MATQPQDNQEPQEGQQPMGGRKEQRILTEEEHRLFMQEIDRLLDEDWEEGDEEIRMDNELKELLSNVTIPTARLGEILPLLAKSPDQPSPREESEQ